jgi:hypothetical protein
MDHGRISDEGLSNVDFFGNLDCSRKLCFYFYNLSDWKGVDVARMSRLATRDQAHGDHPTRFLKKGKARKRIP